MDSGWTSIRYMRNPDQVSKEFADKSMHSSQNSKLLVNESENNYRFNISSSYRVGELRRYPVKLNNSRYVDVPRLLAERKATESQHANFIEASMVDPSQTLIHLRIKQEILEAEAQTREHQERTKKRFRGEPCGDFYLVDSSGFPFPSDQTPDFRVCSRVESERIEEYYRRVISKCHVLCKLCEKKELQQGLESDQLELRQLQGLSARELINLSVVNQHHSKRVQAFLESVDFQTLRSIIEILYEELPQLMVDQFGCYIPGCVIRLDPGFAHFCEAFCLANLGKLCIDKCAVKVMQALAGVSVSFSLEYLAHFKKHYFSLVFNKESMIILNKVILQISDQSLLKFLVEDVEYNFSQKEFERPQLLRLLSSLIERCNGQLLERLVGVMLPHIWWLVDDKFGNYAVLTLLKYPVGREKNLVSSTVLLEPEAMFTKKYRRVLLLNCLISPGYQEFISELLWKLIFQSSHLNQLFEQETATWLFVATLAAEADLKQLKRAKKTVEDRVKADPLSTEAQNLKVFFGEYERLLAILKTGQPKAAKHF